MYQEFKKKESDQNQQKEKYYTLNLNTFRIFSVISFFLFFMSLIFIFGYWLGRLKLNLNSSENLFQNENNQQNVDSKLPLPEQGVINLGDDDQEKEERTIEQKKEELEENKQAQPDEEKPQEENKISTKENKSIKKLSENSINPPKKVTKKEKEKVLPKKETDNPKKGYHLQVSVHKNKKYAFSLKEKLVLKGYHAYIFETGKDKNITYNVYIGPFEKIKDAEDTKEYLAKDFTNLDKSYIIKN